MRWPSIDDADVLLAEAIIDRAVDGGMTYLEAIHEHPESAGLLIWFNYERFPHLYGG